MPTSSTVDRDGQWKEMGIEKGIVIGKEEGREKGIIIGIQETKRDTALRMLEGGVAIADVARFVDLPEMEIRRLAEEPR